MAIEAPLSKYKRNNFIIGIVACIGLALWCGYDGYFNEAFKEDHAQWWGVNRVAPFVLLLMAGALGAWWYAIRNRKLVAAEDALVFAGGKKILYDTIEQIDRTHFDTKGLFTLTYKTESGRLTRHKLSDRQYDNLKPILEHLIAQIS